jgi:hypothetical protein
VKDSVLTNNRGNTYLSIYKTAGVDGLLVEGNEIKLGDGKQTIAGGHAIYVDANRNKEKFVCRKVSIIKNKMAGGGILIRGEMGEDNIVKGNRNVGEGKVKMTIAAAGVKEEDNEGFEPGAKS